MPPSRQAEHVDRGGRPGTFRPPERWCAEQAPRKRVRCLLRDVKVRRDAVAEPALAGLLFALLGELYLAGNRMRGSQ